TVVYTLSLHDALPICISFKYEDFCSKRLGISKPAGSRPVSSTTRPKLIFLVSGATSPTYHLTSLGGRFSKLPWVNRKKPEEFSRSEEHTSELQSLAYL